jgi:hypothetical protein
MKKDHKYGDDICYYREIDEKLDHAVYYVKPCEKGKYCEDLLDPILGIVHPFGFCRDIPTNATDFPSYEKECSTNAECNDNLVCDGTCKYECTGTLDNIKDSSYQHDLDDFECHDYKYTKIEDKYCKKTNHKFNTNYPQTYIGIDGGRALKGKFPGFPKECGIIHYNGFTDYDTSSPIPGSSPTSFKTFTRYLEIDREWCSIGEAKDGDFVDNKRFCKSGFTLPFYPNGDTEDPSGTLYTLNAGKMCVTPTGIDMANPLVGSAQCVITYKVEDSEHKYKTSDTTLCNVNIVIKSQIYTEFIEEFNNATDEDKKNCYKIPQDEEGNCENIKLLQLYYFYHNHIKDYLFYKDRKDLEKVLHFKIQQTYHRYYELSNYLNLNYLLFFLILILL